MAESEYILPSVAQYSHTHIPLLVIHHILNTMLPSVELTDGYLPGQCYNIAQSSHDSDASCQTLNGINVKKIILFTLLSLAARVN